MKKLLMMLAVVVIGLTACSMGGYPSSIEELQTSDIKSIYDDALKEEAVSQTTVSYSTDEGNVYIIDYGQSYAYNFTSTDSKTVVKYTVLEDGTYESIQVTNEFPNPNDMDSDEYYEAVSNIEYLTSEEDIPEANKMSVEELAAKSEEIFNSTFDTIGEITSVEKSENESVVYNILFENGNGSFWQEYSYFSLSSTESQNNIQFSLIKDKLPKSIGTLLYPTETGDGEDTDSESTDSESTDDEDTDSESTDSESTDSESTDSESTDSESTDTE